VRSLSAERRISRGTITRDDFLPTLDQYFFRVATIVDMAIRGYPYLVV
jgi:hypothetical protein